MHLNRTLENCLHAINAQVAELRPVFMPLSKTRRTTTVLLVSHELIINTEALTELSFIESTNFQLCFGYFLYPSRLWKRSLPIRKINLNQQSCETDVKIPKVKLIRTPTRFYLIPGQLQIPFHCFTASVYLFAHALCYGRTPQNPRAHAPVLHRSPPPPTPPPPL